MPTAALSAYGIAVYMGNGIAHAALAISNATNTTPIVVTCAAHGVPVGGVTTVTVAGVTGNLGANGSWIAEALTATTLRLRGSLGTGAYVSGGTLTLTDTYALVAELTNVEDAGLMATLIEVSAHDGNGWSSRIPTFLSGNTMRLTVNLIPADPVHGTDIPTAMVTRARHHWLIVFPDAAHTAWQFTGFITEDRAQAPVAGALTARFSIEMDGEPLLAAA